MRGLVGCVFSGTAREAVRRFLQSLVNVVQLAAVVGVWALTEAKRSECRG